MEHLMTALWDKNPSKGYAALKELLSLSQQSPAVYRYMGRFIEALQSDNSYFRTRALALLAANAKWDSGHLIDENIDTILSHVTDQKPVTARKWIQDLPALAKDKPDLRQDILSALYHADTQFYPLSMRSLVDADIRKAIQEIEG